MDNFTHSLAGWTLGQTGLKTKTRKGLAALILGANMPDIDVFFGWAPWVPLATHRGFTHGLVGGVLLMPPLLFALLWLLDQWQVRRGTTFRSGLAMDPRWLFALSYIGTLTHPLLDLQTSYAVQLLSPFDTRWFHTETLFIIDVWIWSGLAFAIWLSRRRERHGGNWRSPAVIGLIGVCLYIGANGGISMLGRRAVMADTRVQPDILIAGEEPALFWRRQMIWRQNGMIGGAVYDPLRNLNSLSNIKPMVPDHMNVPIVRHAMIANTEIIDFMRWSILPIARVEHGRCVDTVLFSDARFGEPVKGSRFLHVVTLPSEARTCREKVPRP
jgi:inner membrane protein